MDRSVTSQRKAKHAGPVPVRSCAKQPMCWLSGGARNESVSQGRCVYRERSVKFRAQRIETIRLVPPKEKPIHMFLRQFCQGVQDGVVELAQAPRRSLRLGATQCKSVLVR